MKSPDQYTTISDSSEGEFKDRGSKFLAYAYAVYSDEDIKARLEEVRKLHPKARHHCYAWRLGLDQQQFRANDDGEPSGTAGRPILGQIDSFEMTNLLIIVVRYFGGTKLGTSGLINAYRAAAKNALEMATPVDRIVKNRYRIHFHYAAMNDVITYLKKNEIDMLKKTFEASPEILIALPKSEADSILSKLEEIGVAEHVFVGTV